MFLVVTLVIVTNTSLFTSIVRKTLPRGPASLNTDFKTGQEQTGTAPPGEPQGGQAVPRASRRRAMPGLIY